MPTPPIDQLVREYPIHPVYPETGPRHLLLWSHHYERGMLTVARSKQALLDIWKRRWIQDEAGTPLFYVQAMVVSPPQRFREKFARDRYEFDRDMFARQVVSLLPDYRRFHQGALPPGIIFPCRNFQGRFNEQEEDKHHTFCKNCIDQYAAPWEELFLAHRHIFDRQPPDGTRRLEVRDYDHAQRRKQILASRVYTEVPADPTKPLYSVSHDGNWTHPEEVAHVFRPITDETYEYTTSDWFYFFFQGELHDARQDPEWMKPLIQSEQERKEEERIRSEKWAAEHREQQAENNRRVQTIFGCL